jgi:hypothetical protein
VKGFDFAKQHLGQHNKDDILIIHEPAPLPGPVKDHTTPSENGDVPSPKSKIPSKNIRHRGRSLLGFLDCSVAEHVSVFRLSVSNIRRVDGEYCPGFAAGILLTCPKSHTDPRVFFIHSTGLPEQTVQFLSLSVQDE